MSFSDLQWTVAAPTGKQRKCEWITHGLRRRLCGFKFNFFSPYFKIQLYNLDLCQDISWPFNIMRSHDTISTLPIFTGILCLLTHAVFY